MYRLPITKWKLVVSPNDVREESLIEILATVVNSNLNKIPPGLVYFRSINKINAAIQEATVSRLLTLEKEEYNLLKIIIEQGIPAYLGVNKDVVEAIDVFLSAKEAVIQVEPA